MLFTSYERLHSYGFKIPASSRSCFNNSEPAHFAPIIQTILAQNPFWFEERKIPLF